MHKQSYLEQTVADEREEQTLAAALDNATRVYRLEQGGKVEHGDVLVAVVIFGEVELRELLVGGHIGRLFGILTQAIEVDIVLGEQLLGVRIVVLDDALVEQRLPLGGHHEVVRVLLVVDDVLQVDAGLVAQLVEELLIVDVGDSTPLIDFGLDSRAVVDEVGRDAYA